MIFSIWSLYAITLTFYYIGQQLSPHLLISCVKCGFYFYFFIYLFLSSIIGKFGLFPASFGIIGLIDGISLFSSLIILILNKYIYVIILLYFTKPLYYDTASLLVILTLISIYHSTSLNLKAFTLRKFIASTSMITFSVLLINLIYSYLALFYLFWYFILSFAFFSIYHSINIIILSLHILRKLIIGGIFTLGYISFTIFFNKFDILFYTSLLNGFSLLLLYLFSIACNYTYLWIINRLN